MKKLPIKEFENAYEVSEDGEVYSIKRTVLGQDGTLYPFPAKHRTKSANIYTTYFMVTLYRQNMGYCKYIHRLVAEAFIPNPKRLPQVNHIDGNRQNNYVQNLEWVTPLENIQHAIQTGLKTYTNRLTEIEFLDCLHQVIDGESYAGLSKRVPYQVPFLSVKLRKLAKKYNLEHLLDASLMEQRQRRARVNGAKNYTY